MFCILIYEKFSEKRPMNMTIILDVIFSWTSIDDLNRESMNFCYRNRTDKSFASYTL